MKGFLWSMPPRRRVARRKVRESFIDLAWGHSAIEWPGKYRMLHLGWNGTIIPAWTEFHLGQTFVLNASRVSPRRVKSSKGAESGQAPNHDYPYLQHGDRVRRIAGQSTMKIKTDGRYPNFGQRYSDKGQRRQQVKRVQYTNPLEGQPQWSCGYEYTQNDGWQTKMKVRCCIASTKRKINQKADIDRNAQTSQDINRRGNLNERIGVIRTAQPVL